MKRRDILKAAPVALAATVLPIALVSTQDRLESALVELKLALQDANPEVTGLMVMRDGQGEGKVIGAMAITA